MFIRFLFIIFLSILAKNSCPNLKEFQVDVWEAKKMCPNPQVPIFGLQNNPRKGCKKSNPIREIMNKKPKNDNILKQPDNIDTYEQYKKEQQKSHKKEDL